MKLNNWGRIRGFPRLLYPIPKHYLGLSPRETTVCLTSRSTWSTWSPWSTWSSRSQQNRRWVCCFALLWVFKMVHRGQKSLATLQDHQDHRDQQDPKERREVQSVSSPSSCQSSVHSRLSVCHSTRTICILTVHVRLVPGSRSGRVEVLLNDIWGTVCIRNIGHHSSNLLCKMMGYSYASTVSRASPGKKKRC